MQSVNQINHYWGITSIHIQGSVHVLLSHRIRFKLIYSFSDNSFIELKKLSELMYAHRLKDGPLSLLLGSDTVVSMNITQVCQTGRLFGQTLESTTRT